MFEKHSDRPHGQMTNMLESRLFRAESKLPESIRRERIHVAETLLKRQFQQPRIQGAMLSLYPLMCRSRAVGQIFSGIERRDTRLQVSKGSQEHHTV